MVDDDHHHQFLKLLEDIRSGRGVWLPGYAAELERMRREVQGRAAAAPQPRSLRERFEQWWAGLPTALRYRRYAMSEFETALGLPGKFISPVLVELGWRRGRLWSGTGQYQRYWEPPVQSD